MKDIKGTTDCYSKRFRRILMEVSKETENDLMKKKKMHFSFVVSYKLKFYTFACQSFFLNKQFLYIHILIKK